MDFNWAIFIINCIKKSYAVSVSYITFKHYLSSKQLALMDEMRAPCKTINAILVGNPSHPPPSLLLRRGK